MTTNEQYHADTSHISKSGLDLIRRSPAHYHWAYLDPSAPPRKATPEMEFGTAFHTAVLEPGRFRSSYVVTPKFDLRRTADKVAAAEFEERVQSQKLKLISPDDYETVMRMGEEVRKDPIASQLLAAGEAEQTITWKDSTTGAACKCRPDWMSALNWVVDLKSTKDASPSEFGRSSFNFRYHVQAPFYLDGILGGHRRRMEGFAFIAVEKEPPYAVAVYYAPPAMLELGRETYLEDLHTYMKCLETNRWPSYTEDALLPLELPKWAFSRKF